MGKVIQIPRKRKLVINPAENTIVCGDCLDWLKDIPPASIDMCYIDPPFFSNKTYEVIWGNGYELRSFGDRWKGGIEHYIGWMRDRVKLIHRCLKDTGTLFLHCDWHANHRLRVMLDEVFGEKNFRNEIIWSYRRWPVNTRDFQRMHDTLMRFSVSREWQWRQLYESKAESTLKTFGESKVKSSLRHDGSRRPSKLTKEKSKGMPIRDVWDIGVIAPSAKERIGYRTQKPEKLMERIIECCTSENDIVLDCFGGGGTTAAVAARLGRRFVTGDVSPVAVKVMAKRLAPLCTPKIINVPRTHREWLKMDGHTFADKICGFMGWESNPKKSGDMGIDGWTKNRTVPVQIKNQQGKVGRPVVQRLIGAMGECEEGVIVAWGFSPQAHECVAAAKKHGKAIQLLEVAEVLDGILIDEDKAAEIDECFKKVS